MSRYTCAVPHAKKDPPGPPVACRKCLDARDARLVEYELRSLAREARIAELETQLAARVAP